MSTDEKTPDAAPDGERIAKVLSRAGIASRRDAERLILEGRVKVNGKTVTSPALNVTDKDRLAVDGHPVGAPEATRLWLYHKPAGLVTTEKDEEGRPTVFDSLPEDMPRVMSVGRLDLTSEGLLILTNDGEIKRRLELPSTGWLRRYRVRINGALSEAQLDELRQGITVDGIDYQPMEVTFDRQQGANAWLTIGLREGKNREIRRVMEHLGVAVSRLIRISYGPFQLGDLAEGQVEELRSKVVRDQLGLGPKPQPERTRKKAKASEMPVFDEVPDDRPERDRLATARPEGATVKRELKPRTPGARKPRAEGDPAPKPRTVKPRPAKPAPTGPFAKTRTWMRASDPNAAPEEAPREERRPRSAEDRPRSSGFKSHGKPRTEGGEDRPRSAGFRSHADKDDRPRRDYGDRPQRSEGDRGPRPPRSEGDRPARSYGDRERPQRAEGDRGPRRFGGDDRRPPREGGENRPYKPRPPREGEEERPRRAYKPREGGDDRAARPYKPRAEGDRPARPYKPRAEGDRPAGPYKPRAEGDRPARPYKPRAEGDRPARSFQPRREGEGDRPARPYKPRVEGDRPARDFKPRGEDRGPRREGDDSRPSRGFKPREGQGDRPAREGQGDRPRGPREGGDNRPPRDFAPRGPRPEGGRPPRKGPPSGGGFKGRPSSGGPRSGPKPRKG